jgi:hypothetical protein
VRLDVGCGNNPTGDVNCDLHICDVDNHRQTDTPTSVPLNVASNFVLCDCMHLPFADNTFNEVFCAQLIEHLETPMKLMKELVRVSSKRIIVETAHKLSEITAVTPRQRRWLREHHVSKMTNTWLNRAGEACGCMVSRSYVLTWACFPSKYVAFIRVPCGIGVELIKPSTRFEY